MKFAEISLQNLRLLGILIVEKFSDFKIILRNASISRLILKLCCGVSAKYNFKIILRNASISRLILKLCLALNSNKLIEG